MDPNHENIIDNSTNESIISEIKLRAPLWNLRDRGYKDNLLKKKIWEEIAFNLQMDENFVKTRWKSLRDRYFREIKKTKTTSGQGAVTQTSWGFYSSMKFLSGVVEPRHTTTSMSRDQTFSYSTSGVILADLNVESMTNQNYATVKEARILATQNHTNIPAELLSPTSSIDSQELSQLSSGEQSGWSGLPEHSSNNKPGCSGKRPTSSQSSRNSKTKKADHDPLETAILDLVKNKQSPAAKQELTSEEHFYLSVAQDVTRMNFASRMKMRQAVLRAFVEILEEQDADTAL